jgi:hypothetical protein
MSAFLSDCILRVFDDDDVRPIFVLQEPLVYQSDLAGTITVPAGVLTDLASIPQVGMGLIGYPGARAAVVHDWLIDTAVDRRLADKVFCEALGVCGVPDDKAALMYMAVRMYSEATT